MAASAAELVEVSGDFEKTRSYSCTYLVITDVGDGPLTAVQASGIPARGSAYNIGTESDSWSFATRYSAKLASVDNSRKKWMVTVQFQHPSDSQQQDEKADDYAGDPIDTGWKISGSFANEQRAAYKDKDGDLIANSADEQFLDPPLMRDNAIDTVVLRKNTATINLSDRSAIINKVNDGAFWGMAARQVKLVRWDYEIVWYGANDAYVANTWEFQIKSQLDDDNNQVGWTDLVLDEGTRYLLDNTKVKPQERFADIIVNGKVSREKLDGAGGVLDNGDPPVFLPFPIEDEVDFTAYNFPDPLPGPFV